MIKFNLVKNCKSINKVLNAPQQDIQFNIVTDSRSVNPGDGFIALKGEKFDAFNFIQSVVEKNPALIVIHSNREQEIQAYLKSNPQITWVLVSDTLLFTQEIAREKIIEFQKNKRNLTFAISGSNGKTTHKEMLYHFLNSILPSQVTCTLKNNNNHLGVPLTIFQIEDKTQVAIIELGSNHPGEIKTLCDICLPQAGVVTNIGATHLEFFDTEENVFLEEGYLYYAVKNHTQSKGLFIQNCFDKFLSKLEKTEGTLSVGGKNTDALFKFNSDSVEIKFKNDTYLLENKNILGQHNFHNLAVTFLISLYYFPEKVNSLVEAAKNFRPKDLRSMWIDFNSKKIFLDAYNANPSSMRVSLEGFINYCEEKMINLNEVYFVLADMNELGNNGQQYHEEIGSFLATKNVKNVAFIGKYSQHYQTGYRGNSQQFANALQFKQEAWQEVQKKFKFFFFKGSRSLQLETILDIKDH